MLRVGLVGGGADPEVWRTFFFLYIFFCCCKNNMVNVASEWAVIGPCMVEYFFFSMYLYLSRHLCFGRSEIINMRLYFGDCM